MKKRSKMQKTCAVLLAAVMLLSICTGCASGGKAGENAQQEATRTALPEKKESQPPGSAAAPRDEGADTVKEEVKLAENPAAEEKPEAAVPEKAPQEMPQEEKETESQTGGADASSKGSTCTISISCETVPDNPDACSEAKRAIVPSDGVILSAAEVSFTEGETVFDVLQRVCRSNGISLDFSDTALYGVYIKGIANLYEKDFGSMSGWMYRVNGAFPNFGCASYTLRDGDSVEWVYTCG